MPFDPDAVGMIDHDLRNVRRFDIALDWTKGLEEHRDRAGFELVELEGGLCGRCRHAAIVLARRAHVRLKAIRFS